VKQGLAIGALVCGILGLCLWPLGPLAVVLGIVALVKASNAPHRYGGKGLAVGGICTGAVSIIVLPLMISILLPSLSRARELSKRLVCSANMKGIGTALKIYAADSYGQYPPDLQVFIDGGGCTEKQFWCPSSDAALGDIHACYVYIPGQSEGNYDTRNVLLYEKQENHEEGGNVLFQDGHVEFIKPYSRVLELVAETEARIAERRAREAAGPRGP
jgi:prepilin-type processing-associated H-X9-DG protein